MRICRDDQGGSQRSAPPDVNVYISLTIQPAPVKTFFGSRMQPSTMVDRIHPFTAPESDARVNCLLAITNTMSTGSTVSVLAAIRRFQGV